jgi:hypothetical protein
MEHHETWCDWCQQDDKVNYQQACGLPGNEPGLIGEKWPNGWAPVDADSAVWEYGWAIFEREVKRPEQRFPPREGKPEVILKAYTAHESIHVCAHCLSQLSHDRGDGADIHRWLTAGRWHVRQSGKSLENYSRAMQGKAAT